MNHFQEKLSETIWNLKYRYCHHEKVVDHALEDTWQRVAKAIAHAENKTDRLAWQQQFYDILADFQFLPGGRILSGAGTRHKVTLFNCFVMPILEDSIQGIFNALKEGAITLQQGGGIGYDFSLLRPYGARVHKTESLASGPLSFMRIWNAMCATMLSTGARRGAMMGVLRCDHPDIEEFIRAKSDPKELRHFNVSVLVTDAFMQAVKENREWELVFPVSAADSNADCLYRRWSGAADPVPCRVFKRVKARQLWERIMQSAYDYAEPGVLFEDTINHMNNLWYREWISATNPCGEIPLPAYGACNLGAINLTQFVVHPFASNATLQWDKLKNTVRIATRFLDNVIDVSRYPLKLQHAEARGTRRIGLGLAGLGDAFVMLGLAYGSEASLKLAADLMKCIAETTWQTSIELAKEKGVFPWYDAKKYSEGHFVQKLSPDIQAAIQKYGVRHSHHNTIAPTGTISLLANNISSGIEPIFHAYHDRTVRLPEGELKTFSVMNYALRLWLQLKKEKGLPPAWVDSQSLLPQDHLKMQCAVQPYIDNAISKTINIPEDFPFEKLSDVYTAAYEYGLKGCTVFRPNEITGSVLIATEPEERVDKCCQI